MPISAITPLCRDPKDDYLLSLSIASEAHFLITGDADLLELQQIHNTIIIKYTDFDRVMNSTQ
jgi:predicted nucleic acid-binding protein